MGWRKHNGKAAWIGLMIVAATANGPTAFAGNWAEGLFAEASHDFGPVPRGAVVRHPFVLINRTAEPITILNVRASCGCTTGKASNAPISPGNPAWSRRRWTPGTSSAGSRPACSSPS